MRRPAAGVAQVGDGPEQPGERAAAQALHPQQKPAVQAAEVAAWRGIDRVASAPGRIEGAGHREHVRFPAGGGDGDDGAMR
jgi:hypothetical protein